MFWKGNTRFNQIWFKNSNMLNLRVVFIYNTFFENALFGHILSEIL